MLHVTCVVAVLTSPLCSSSSLHSTGIANCPTRYMHQAPPSPQYTSHFEQQLWLGTMRPQDETLATSERQLWRDECDAAAWAAYLKGVEHVAAAAGVAVLDCTGDKRVTSAGEESRDKTHTCTQAAEATRGPDTPQSPSSQLRQPDSARSHNVKRRCRIMIRGEELHRCQHTPTHLAYG